MRLALALVVLTTPACAETFLARWEPVYGIPPDAPVVVAKPPPVTRVAQTAAVRTTNLCEQHGLRRINYSRSGHKYWRCGR